jgi:hypothetical protein
MYAREKESQLKTLGGDPRQQESPPSLPSTQLLLSKNFQGSPKGNFVTQFAVELIARSAIGNARRGLSIGVSYRYFGYGTMTVFGATHSKFGFVFVQVAAMDSDLVAGATQLGNSGCVFHKAIVARFWALSKDFLKSKTKSSLFMTRKILQILWLDLI